MSGDPHYPQPQGDTRYAQPQGDTRYAQSQGDTRYAQSQGDTRYAQPEEDTRYAQSQGDSRYAQPNYPPPPSPPTGKTFHPGSTNSTSLPDTSYQRGAMPDSQLEPSHPTVDRPHHSIMHETPDELTEDERIEYEKGVMTWSKAKNWRFWIRREWLWYYIIFALIVVVVGLMVFFHHDIINWLTPFTRRLQTLNAGFLIPAAILFVLSFPPLFGNEIVMILVGVVWGLGKGFAIVAVGICLGELANFFLFKYCCHNRAERMTKKNLNYACLSQAITEGGFLMAFVVRLSVIPTHVTTAILAVCGLQWYHFAVALVLGLPKQLIAVYVGVVLAETNASTNSHVVSDCVFAASAVVTIGALWYIYNRMLAVRKKVILGMRDDLKSKHVAVSDPNANTEFTQAGVDERNWHNPFATEAVTEPRK